MRAEVLSECNARRTEVKNCQQQMGTCVGVATGNRCRGTVVVHVVRGALWEWHRSGSCIKNDSMATPGLLDCDSSFVHNKRIIARQNKNLVVTSAESTSVRPFDPDRRGVHVGRDKTKPAVVRKMGATSTDAGSASSYIPKRLVMLSEVWPW